MMGTTSKVRVGYTVFVLVSVILQQQAIWGGVFISTTLGSVPSLCLYSVLLYFFSFHELANAFSKLSTTVLLCSEARLQEEIEECGVPPHFRDVSRTRLDRRVLVHLYLIRLKYFHELEF